MDLAVLSLRRIRQVVHYGSLLDAEDVLVDCHSGRRYDVTLRSPALTGRLSTWGKGRRLMSISQMSHAFGIEPVPERRADVLVIIANDLHDLAIATSAAGWNKLADEVIVFLFELGDRHVRLYPDVLRRLSDHVDHVFMVASVVEVERLRRGRVRTAAELLPLADALHFTFRPHHERPVDAWSYGRRSPNQHAALVKWQEESDGFFLFDTGSIAEVWDLADHRAKFLDIMSRTRMVVTNYARFDEPGNIMDERPMGVRFIEAAAGGVVLAGERPVLRIPEYDDLFDELPTVDFPLDSNNIPDHLEQVLADRGISDELGRASRRVALKRLDVAHQWTLMMDKAGLPIVPGIHSRLEKLDQAADSLT